MNFSSTLFAPTRLKYDSLNGNPTATNSFRRKCVVPNDYLLFKYTMWNISPIEKKQQQQEQRS